MEKRVFKRGCDGTWTWSDARGSWATLDPYDNGDWWWTISVQGTVRSADRYVTFATAKSQAREALDTILSVLS